MSEFIRLYPSFPILYTSGGSILEACIGVLGIQDVCYFTSRDIGYCPFYFQGYRILSILLPGI